MPARNLLRIKEIGIYSHIYNKGVEKRILFNDEDDYTVFLGFLKDYLSAPKHPDSLKKAFKVHGRTFQGTPHQPKNYFNQVELISYNLMPDHFHLILHQKTRGSLENFIRSLCTRYSIYYNKKYHRTGSLFEGPYKSVQITDGSQLLQLTRYLHYASDYTSYAEFLGKRETSWVNPKVVQSYFDRVQAELFKETDSYKNFVEKYEFDQKGKDSIKKIIFESETHHLERRTPSRSLENSFLENSTENSEEPHQENQILKPHQRIPEMLIITLVFITLVGMGTRNIMVRSAKAPHSSTLGTQTNIVPSRVPTPTVTPTPTAVPTDTPTPTASPTPSPDLPRDGSHMTSEEPIQKKTIMRVSITDGSPSVEVYKGPTTASDIIGEAQDGATIAIVAIHSTWYEIQVEDGSIGFIQAQYMQPMEATHEQ